eukprot:COSAG01_NODE_3871_length_5604_cov_15.632334_12_plen_71_part_00
MALLAARSTTVHTLHTASKPAESEIDPKCSPEILGRRGDPIRVLTDNILSSNTITVRPTGMGKEDIFGFF